MYGLVQFSYEFGHKGTNYDQDQENASKDSVWAMQVVIKWSKTACVK